MSLPSILRIGTRGSALALAQANLVRSLLQQRFPDLETSLTIIKTTGDLRTDVPLSQVAKSSGVVDKGVFIKELELALEQGEIDLAVHSLKDMPSVLAPGFTLGAILPREDTSDVIVSRHGPGPDSLPGACFLPGQGRPCRGVIGTSSVRRARQLSFLCPGVTTVDWRGNVPTRLAKLAAAEQGADAILLARAGLNRLGFTGDTILVDGHTLHVTSLDPQSFIPAAGQGAIAIETRLADAASLQLVSALNDEATARCVHFERRVLAGLNAGCSTPVGAWATPSAATPGHVRCHFRFFPENPLERDNDRPLVDIVWEQDPLAPLEPDFSGLVP